ncbi:transcription factor ATOH8 isoform X2 [Hemicordylus capensis]|uniref:transcription factor ATOH8 isoform X2 n=1 Tax=Hemicordylus capensis TaxID=884348 RepID=UPI0023040125|nr:transcription factor ATOH8 isoform X2 [Hemicordylus capensis]
MKNMQLVEEAERWKRLCLKELGGGSSSSSSIKTLKRKSKEPAKLPLNGCSRSLHAEHHLKAHHEQHVLLGEMLAGKAGSRPASQASASKATAAARDLTEGSGEAIDMRKAAFPAGLLASPQQQPLRKDTCLGSVGLNGAESQAFPDQSLPSRIVVCRQQQQQQPPPRPLESSYPSVSHVIYNSNPDSSPSPRKRLGEAAGASSEIKAIQQTRRLLANARERTRVHTISAAFEALRKQVPCYSYGQKLSKLAILRIACNYILSLARLADLDYSADHSNMSFSECVEQCTRTLQAEGRSKKRKE